MTRVGIAAASTLTVGIFIAYLFSWVGLGDALLIVCVTAALLLVVIAGVLADVRDDVADWRERQRR